MAVIYIKDLVVEGKHGLHTHEKEQAQRFKISVELTLDTIQAEQSDNISDTINWSVVRDQIVTIVQGNSFNLIEKLARAIADQLLKDRRIIKVLIEVAKLDAFPSGMPGVRLEASN